MKNHDESAEDPIKLLAAWNSMASSILNSIGGVYVNDRQRASLALLQLCREHTMSISVLLIGGDGHVTGSCLALLRPALDALLRGWWCGKCLSDEEFSSKWVTGKLFENKKRMMKEVMQSSHPDLAQAFDKYSKSVHPSYHDFTHGGMAQILRRFGANGEIGAPSKWVETRYIAYTALGLDIHAAELFAEVMGKAKWIEALRGLQLELGVPQEPVEISI